MEEVNGMEYEANIRQCVWYHCIPLVHSLDVFSCVCSRQLALALSCVGNVQIYFKHEVYINCFELKQCLGYKYIPTSLNRSQAIWMRLLSSDTSQHSLPSTLTCLVIPPVSITVNYPLPYYPVLVQCLIVAVLFDLSFKGILFNSLRCISFTNMHCCTNSQCCV